MNLKPIKQNMTEVNVGTKSILFSYKTPVACFDYSEGAGHGVYYKTSKKWSRTTTRHINQWIPDSGEVSIQEKDQEWFDNLLNEVK